MLGWGAFFLTAGGVPLAVQAGALPPGALDRSWYVWPLILVGIGIGLIFSKTPLEVVGGLIVSATLGLMVGGAIASGGFGGVIGFASGGCAPDDFGSREAGLVQVGGAWETPGYDTAVTRIELWTEANAGSFRLNPEEGRG